MYSWDSLDKEANLPRLEAFTPVPESDNCCKAFNGCKAAKSVPLILVKERLSLRRFTNCAIVDKSLSVTGILFKLSETICSFTGSNSFNCADLNCDAPKNSTPKAGEPMASGVMKR